MKYKGLIMDLEGTLLSSGKALPGAVELMQYSEINKIPVRIITNTVSKSPWDLSGLLATQGIHIPSEHIISPVTVLDEYLNCHNIRTFFFVGPVKRIYHYLIQGSVLITTSYSEYYLSGGIKKLDTGSFTRMFELVSRQKAVVLGKPSRTIYETAVKQLGCLPSEIISVGDDILTDVPGAKEAGLKPVLVRTGKYRPEDELGSDDCVVVNDLYEFIARMENATLSI